MDIHDDLASLLKCGLTSRNLIMYRGPDELDFFQRWLAGNNAPNVMPVSGKIETSIEDMILSCRKCGGVAERKVGAGTGSNHVMIILNAPRLMNSIEIRILKNDSVEMLKKIIAAAGFEFKECYITNITKCENEDHPVRPSRMIENCLEILSAEIEWIKPKMIIVMGDIMPLQGIVHESSGIVWHNIEHPVTLIKNPDLKRNAWNTIKLAVQNYKKR